MNILYVTFAVVILDQITKIVVKGISIPFLGITLSGMEYGQSYNVFGDFFKITFVENPGMAFGIDVSDTSKLFLSLFSLVASIGIGSTQNFDLRLRMPSSTSTYSSQTVSVTVQATTP